MFELARGGLMLREVAPGIASEKDILPLMEFAPAAVESRLMPANCFEPS